MKNSQHLESRSIRIQSPICLQKRVHVSRSFKTQHHCNTPYQTFYTSHSTSTLFSIPRQAKNLELQKGQNRYGARRRHHQAGTCQVDRTNRARLKEGRSFLSLRRLLQTHRLYWTGRQCIRKWTQISIYGRQPCSSTVSYWKILDVRLY